MRECVYQLTILIYRVLLTESTLVYSKYRVYLVPTTKFWIVKKNSFCWWYFIFKEGNGFALNLFSYKKSENSSLFFPERHFKEIFQMMHCIFIDYKRLLNFKQLKRTKAISRELSPLEQYQWLSRQWHQKSGFHEGMGAQQLLAAGQWVGTVHWAFNWYFALGHALLFQLNLWHKKSLVPFFLHLIT